MKPNHFLTRFTLLVVAAALIFAGDLNASAELRDGLVSYWPLDVDNGGTTPDDSFDNDMTLFNSPSVVAGQRNNAFSFNGTSQYLNLVHGATYADTGLPIYAAGSYTIVFWVNAPPVGTGGNANDRYVFSEAYTGAANPFLLFQTRNGTTAADTNKLDVILRADGGGTPLNHKKSTSVVFDNTWHHVAWVDNGGDVKLYVDGVLDATSFSYTNTAAIALLNNTSIGALVRTGVGGYFKGLIDDVAVWERALTAAEVDEVRTNGILTPVPARAPVLAVEPVSATVHVGDWVLQTPRAINNRPLTYQWFSNGVPILGATDRTYRITNLQTNNNDDQYSVIVTNPVNFVSSSNAVMTVTPDPESAVASGLISYWPFDSVTNGYTPDLYGGSHMVLVAMDENNLIPSLHNNALSFDGFTQYTIRSNGFPIYNNTDYSISLWVKGDGSTQNSKRIYAESAGTATPIFSIDTGAGTDQNLAMFIRNDTTVGGTPLNGLRSTSTPLDDAWHHIVWTDANGKGKLYVDGVLDLTDFTYTRGFLTISNTTVGGLYRTAADNFFWGNVDEVATWNRVLSWTEIQEIMTNGVPAPVAPIAPSITAQPTGSNGFSGLDIILSAQASGTPPLWLQWYKDNAPLTDETNFTLILLNAQTNDSGTYTLLVTNSAGSDLSSNAIVTITPRPAPPAVLAIDFDDRAATPEDLQPGFQSFVLGGSGGVGAPTLKLFGGVEVTVSPLGSTLDTRERTTLVDNEFFTESRLFNDFIFNSATTGNNGVQVQTRFLLTNKTYAVTLWSFDSGGPGTRVSDWTANATSVASPYSFTETELPTVNGQYQMNFNIASDETGRIVIEGRRNDATSGGQGVFLNAMRIQLPPPQITNGELLGNGDVRLTVETTDPTDLHKVQQSPDVTSGNWTDVSATLTQTGPTTLQFEFAPLSAPRFYRITRSAVQ